jgi:hypothetical protein
MIDCYILNLKYDFSPPIIIKKDEPHCSVTRRKFIESGGRKVHMIQSKSLIRLRPVLRSKSYIPGIETTLYYSYMSIPENVVCNCKEYVGSHVRTSGRPLGCIKEKVILDVIDPDYISRPALCLSPGVLVHPVTYSEYNTIIRSCDCIGCGNTFIYPHIVGVRLGRIHMDSRHCKDCSILRNDRYFKFDYMDLERSYYLGVCYANMQFVYSSSGEVYIKIYGDYDLLAGLLKSIGVDKKISGDRSVKEVVNSRYCYLLFNQYYYYYDLVEIGFTDDIMLLGHPDLPIELYGSFVSGFLRNSETFVRGEFVYIAIASKVISRMVMEQFHLDGIDCWEEFCNRKMCVVYRRITPSI